MGDEPGTPLRRKDRPSVEWREALPGAHQVKGGRGGSPYGDPIQILATRDESQWIVAARPLYHLQYPVATKSSAEDLPH